MLDFESAFMVIFPEILRFLKRFNVDFLLDFMFYLKDFMLEKFL